MMSVAGPAVLAAPSTDLGSRFDSEQLFSPRNDWEPVVAADPSSSFVYLVVTGLGASECTRARRATFSLTGTTSGLRRTPVERTS